MGKALIIQGADFSQNSVPVFKKVTNLVYNSDGQGNFQVYEGNPYPIPNTNGCYYGNPTNPGKIANCIVTGLIPIDGFSHFDVHSIFNLTSSSNTIIAIAFSDANRSTFAFYSTQERDLSVTGCLGKVPANDRWIDFSGSIPEGSEYIAVACYGLTSANEYQNFKLMLY